MIWTKDVPTIFLGWMDALVAKGPTRRAWWCRRLAAASRNSGR